MTRLIGQGNFADVYLGEHILLKTKAALKMLHIPLSEDAIAEFLNEARTIAHLEHPHIVRVLEYGVEDKTPFLVMGYAPNGTLRRRYPRGQHLSVEEVLLYVQQIAAALDYAHQRKLIHRDIKPENILLGHQNEVLLSDFGLALVAHSSNPQTRKEMAGTVSYMAPEQLQGKARPASDQYALGIMVYEWLSGERPFQGSFVEVASQHLLTPPPALHGRIPGISAEVQNVVFQALAKEPEQRFPNVQAFATALAQAANVIQRPLANQHLTAFPQHDTPYSTLLMNSSAPFMDSIHTAMPSNRLSGSTPLSMSASSNRSQPSGSEYSPMSTLQPYQQIANKKRYLSLSKGNVALLIGLVLLVLLSSAIAPFIIKPVLSTISTPTPSKGTATSTTNCCATTAAPISVARTPDMSLVPHSMQLLGFTGWDYSGTKVILPPMRQIPAGPFKMGSDPKQDPDATTYDKDTQQPIQQFSLTLGAYQIGTYDVTVAEYELAVRAGKVLEPLSPPKEALGNDPVITWHDQLLHLDYPVINISWRDTMRYTKWLSQVTGISWRLPTEAQWEKAARGTDGRIYSYGNTYMQDWANTKDAQNSNLSLTSVGAYPQDKSPYGVFDMSGNVLQWTSTIYRASSYSLNDGRENTSDTISHRTQRGGSWDGDHQYGRCAYRGLGSDPGSYHPRVGFRLAY